MPLTTPYADIPPTERAKMGARVDVKHVVYLERLFPMQVGLQDRILSTLFHRFITHLQQIEHDNAQPIEPAWIVGDPSYLLLDVILARTNFTDVDVLRERIAALERDLADANQRCAAGRVAGISGGADGTGGAGSVRPKVRRAKKQRPDPEGDAGQGSGGEPRSGTES